MSAASPLDRDDPRRIGGYRLVGRLGTGGQGVVYLAQAPDGRGVAVKVLHARLSRDPKARRRLLREIEALRRVRQFCTARVLDVDTSGDRPYVVSEYVPGPTLARLVRAEGPRGPDALERLATATLTALAAIHRAGIVHRDFKPGNIIYGPDGPRVIDFGLARITGGTATTDSIGTPAFVAPEVVSGATADARSDLFGWGVTLVFAATGTPAFGSDTIPAVLHRILHEEPDLTALTEPLRSVVASCLAKDPADRPTATGALLALLAHDGGPAEGEEGEEGDGLAETRLMELPGTAREEPPTGEPDAPVRHEELDGPATEPGGGSLGAAPTEPLGLPAPDGPNGPNEPDGSDALDALDALEGPARPGRRVLLGAAAGTALLAAIPAALLLRDGDGEPRPGGPPTLTGTAPPRRLTEAAVLPAQPDTVYAALYNADGTELFTSSAEAVLRWNVAERKVVRTYRGIRSSLELSPDGSTLASAASDNSARLVEVSGGRELKALAHPSWVAALSWSPDGTVLATGSHDGRARLWDTGTGKTLRVLEGHTDWVTSVDHSPDGRTLATASNDRTIRLWDTATGSPRRVLTGHAYWVQAVRFSPDGARLASGGADNTVRIWDTATGRLLAVLDGHRGRVDTVGFSRDGTALVSAGHDRTVRLWDAATGSATAVAAGHTDWVFAAGFGPDGTGLVTAGADRTIRLWRIS
ncbi:WD40 repeat domain-containing serine/threonine protein kinase [Actinocorallia libanotica]|uniref:Protein kinase domain-containing protein n=1 Tax=Actinocorallia libanotica TaxID=46162 RepID=A0ABN1RUN7_9ACTN